MHHVASSARSTVLDPIEICKYQTTSSRKLVTSTMTAIVKPYM